MTIRNPFKNWQKDSSAGSQKKAWTRCKETLDTQTVVTVSAADKDTFAQAILDGDYDSWPDTYVIKVFTEWPA